MKINFEQVTDQILQLISENKNCPKYFLVNDVRRLFEDQIKDMQHEAYEDGYATGYAEAKDQYCEDY